MGAADSIPSRLPVSDTATSDAAQYAYDARAGTSPIGTTQRSVPGDYKFTGKERDSESNLDMFGARYYGSSLGRFMTPDWSTSSNPDPVPYAD